MGTFPAGRGLLRQLLASAKTGDSEAFGQIMLLNQRMILRVSQRMLLDPDAAKDVAQEVFLRLHRSIGRFDEEKDLEPWLYCTAVNLCRDRLRRSKKDLHIDLLEPPLLASADDPERTAIASERYRLVLAALQILSPREREAIVMRDLEGKSTAEVAAILGSSETTVRSQLSTGRTKMKNFVISRITGRK